MTDKPKREITIDDIIKATENMEDAEYRDFMKLRGPQRIEAARAILDNLDKEGK